MIFTKHRTKDWSSNVKTSNYTYIITFYFTASRLYRIS